MRLRHTPVASRRPQRKPPEVGKGVWGVQGVKQCYTLKEVCVAKEVAHGSNPGRTWPEQPEPAAAHELEPAVHTARGSRGASASSELAQVQQSPSP